MLPKTLAQLVLGDLVRAPLGSAQGVIAHKGYADALVHAE